MKDNNIRYARALLQVRISVFLLGIWGILTIISSQVDHEFPLRLAGRQLIFFLLGMLVLELSRRIPFKFYRRHALVLGSAGLLSLLPVLFFGEKINGMRGWYDLGEFMLQPSELAKGLFLLGGARIISSFRRDSICCFLAGGAWTALWALLLLLQPDFGTASVYISGFFFLYFAAGGGWRKLCGAGAVGMTAAGIFIWTHPYTWRRFIGLYSDRDPLGAGWHVSQLKFAIARGGWFGTHMERAYWSNAYVPFAYNDSAFATMLETLGFLGTLPILFGGTILLTALGSLALQKELRRSARILIAGCTLLTAFQALLHLSVNVCLLPPTGLTLPLVSYGGSSFIGCCFTIGLALSAAAEGAKNTL